MPGFEGNAGYNPYYEGPTTEDLAAQFGLVDRQFFVKRDDDTLEKGWSIEVVLPSDSTGNQQLIITKLELDNPAGSKVKKVSENDLLSWNR